MPSFSEREVLSPTSRGFGGGGGTQRKIIFAVMAAAAFGVASILSSTLQLVISSNGETTTHYMDDVAFQPQTLAMRPNNTVTTSNYNSSTPKPVKNYTTTSENNFTPAIAKTEKNDDQKDGNITRVACVGDSLTRGGGQGDNYPDMLQGLLGDRYQVGNFGKHSATATSEVRFSYNLTIDFQQALAFQPHLVLCMFGSNDVKYFRAPPVMETKGSRFLPSYEWIIQQFQALPTRPRILVAIPPWISKPYLMRFDIHLVNHVIPRIQNMTTKLQLELVDMRSVTIGKNQTADTTIYEDDGIHLNHRGRTILANVWQNAILRKPKVNS